ncbi:cellulose binding domain-containing protein [Sphaerisporangium sp. NPDC005289]|uniref:cellulose binding domain-containing protein n=1 Tax=Sphaerisporangium sp. NPDC005289 TaxID=3155247 RepID=UPI0033B3E40C
MGLRAPCSWGRWAASAVASLALALTAVSGAYAAAPASPASGSGAVSAADTTPPSKPTGLHEPCSSDTLYVLFCWTASTDDVGVVAYDVYRQGDTGYVQVGTSSFPAFGDDDVVIGRTYTYIVIARDAAGNQSAPSDPFVALARGGLPSPSASPSHTPTPPSLACHVTYEFVAWRTGQNAWITVKNTGKAPIDGWTLSIVWSQPAPRLTSGHSAVWSQSGATFNARNQAWNKVIPAGGSVQTGFTAAHVGATPEPSTFAINGVGCSATLIPRG